MKVVVTLILLFTTYLLHAQDKTTGTIRGIIFDGITGETIPMAEIQLTPSGRRTSSDLDGVYTFTKLSPGTYSIKVSYTEYPSMSITEIVVVANQVTEVDVTMQDSVGTTKIEEFVVTAKRNRETVNDLYLEQKKAAYASDGVSAEVIKRTPAKSAVDVLKMVSGASIQDNKFAVIRGLNDRYNAAYLNGGPLPSSESDRKAFSFDIFPANMLDKLVIAKTATPDQPAEFAGGIIMINTKSIPEKKFYTVSIGSAYNTITTFKAQQSYAGGKMDWIGVDDGSRKLSSNVPSFENYPSSIHDQATIAKQFSTNWGLIDRKFSPNYNLQFAMGFNPKIRDREVGIIASLTYSRSFNFNQTTRRGYANSVDPTSPTSQLEYEYLDKNNSEQVLAGGLANFTYKLNENNSFGFKNIYSINSDDRLINRTGEVGPLENNPLLLRSNARWFTSNNIYSGQFNGDHLLKKSKLRIEWLVSYSNIKRTIPSLNRSIYTRYKYLTDPTNPNPSDTVYTANISETSVGPSYGGGMFFSENKEYSTSARLDFTLPVVFFKKIKSDFKFGSMAQLRNRTFAARQLGYTTYNVSGGNIDFKQSLLTLPEDQIFAPENMGLIQAPNGPVNGIGGFKLTDGTKNSDAYQASSNLYAGYLMLDNRFNNDMRLVWGVRAEYFQQQLTAMRVDKSLLELNTAKLDILPSVNFIYSMTKRQNLRFSYSQTLNRPEYRELAPFAFFDFNTNFVLSGNDSLVRASIQNLDLRYEFFPGRGQILSATVFYKHFTNPIEQISRPDVTSEISFKNVPTAQNYGLEIEARSLVSSIFKLDTNSIFDKLTVYTNISIIRSQVDVSDIVGTAASSRPLQGQSPYVFNAGVYYNNMRHNWGMSVSLNKVGPRIYIVGNVNEPDLWENSRAFLDLQLTKTFWNNRAEFKINAQNILAQKQEFYQNTRNSEDAKGVSGLFNSIFVGDKNNRTGLDYAADDVIWSTVFGRTISASLSIRF